MTFFLFSEVNRFHLPGRSGRSLGNLARAHSGQKYLRSMSVPEHNINVRTARMFMLASPCFSC